VKNRWGEQILRSLRSRLYAINSVHICGDITGNYIQYANAIGWYNILMTLLLMENCT